MSDATFASGVLRALREIVEGGEPGQPTMAIDHTAPDGSGNSGLLATLDAFDAARASRATALGLTAAGHAAHAAFYLEVALRRARGECGSYDWPGSFEPRTVDEAGWNATRRRLRAAYESLVAFARAKADWSEADATGLAAALSHTAYHLGAVRQLAKLAGAPPDQR